MAEGSKQRVDWFDCTAWGGVARRTVSGWRVGDEVSLEGALRRRFYRAGEGTSTRLEVEVLSGRLVARASPTTG
jgi:single-strand DNA-binding protein